MEERKLKFQVVGVARSGTTWLADLLASHPDILLMKEPFHHQWEGRRNRHREFWYDNQYFYAYPDQKEDNGKGHYTRARKYLKEKVWTLPGTVVGCKNLFSHLKQYEDLQKYFARMGDELYTVMITRNPIRSHLSGLHARSTNQWEVRPSKIHQKVMVREPIALDIGATTEAIERIEWSIRTILSCCSNVLHVDYARLCSDHYETMGEVLHFLQVRPWACSPDLVKLQPGDIRSHVTNWAELAAGLPEKYRHYAEEEEIL